MAMVGRWLRIWDEWWTGGSLRPPLAATMWNHAPGMWAAMRDRQITADELDQQAAQDLMAFFYAARFFEKPGDAGRGKRAFESLGCAGCHGLTLAAQLAGKSQAAKPVSDWQALADPMELARCDVESPFPNAQLVLLQKASLFRNSARRT